MEERNKITLVCTSHNPNLELLNKMLHSAQGFDSVILHINGEYVRHDFVKYGIEIKLSIPEAYNKFIKDFVYTEWVCCFCDDDYFYPSGLSKMIQEVHLGIDTDVAHFNFTISGYRPFKDYRSWILGKEYELGERQPITPSLLSKHNRLPAGSFFRKSAWEKVGGFQGDASHDWYLWFMMANAGLRFKYYDVLVYNLVRRKGSAWERQHK